MGGNPLPNYVLLKYLMDSQRKRISYSVILKKGIKDVNNFCYCHKEIKQCYPAAKIIFIKNILKFFIDLLVVF
jgi:hypothetical protein